MREDLLPLQGLLRVRRVLLRVLPLLQQLSHFLVAPKLPDYTKPFLIVMEVVFYATRLAPILER